MNRNINNLYNIANKESRLIVGLMSGTSLDGLDIALCLIHGSGAETRLQMLAFETLDYTDSFRNEIRSVFSKAFVSMDILSAMNAKIGIAHAHLVNKSLKKWKVDAKNVDLVASHGQTVFHAPNPINKEFPRSTFQIGDGDHIAVNTGIITVSDFRQKHIAAGGEGAPLVIYGDYLLFSHQSENRVMLNIGGISNITFLPNEKRTEGLFATDTGPGNTLMNQYVQKHYSKDFDENGAIASSGKVSKQLLGALLADPFFLRDSPKTTGPELFNLTYLLEAQKKSDTTQLSSSDIMATLCAFTAKAIVNAISPLTREYDNIAIYVSGGGVNNPVLMEHIANDLTGIPIENTSVLGIDPGAKEAILFALLANETIAGAPTVFSDLSGAPAVCLGKISFPH